MLGRDATIKTVASVSALRNRATTRASVAGSNADVVSSIRSSAGRRTSARAKATRWRCPPLRLTPRSPTSVDNCLGRSSTKSRPSAVAKAAQISSSSNGNPNAMFSRSEAARRKASCRTIARSPSTATLPDVGGISPAARRNSVVLPLPVVPTRATVLPLAKEIWIPLSTGRPGSNSYVTSPKDRPMPAAGTPILSSGSAAIGASSTSRTRFHPAIECGSADSAKPIRRSGKTSSVNM